MNICKKGDIVYLKFKSLDKLDFINHTVSTRLGGVSSIDGLESMNLGTRTIDTPDNIRQNYTLFCSAAGYDEKRVVLANQTHSLNVRYATADDCGKGVFTKRDYTDVDALITDYKGLPLVIHTADCVPVTIIDTVNKTIGIAHCGWRGTYGMLSKLTLDAMNKKFGTNPGDVVSVIGPAICQSCYEVSEELYNDFILRFGKSEALINNNAFYIDLCAINRDTLINCGVSPQNITVSDICTCCNTKYLFSHRGQGPKRGIFASFIELV